MFSELLRAFDALNDNYMGGILTYQNYVATSSNVNTTVDDILISHINPNSASSNPQKRFIGGINLDRFGSGSNDTILHGTSSIGQMINIQMNFSAQTSEALNLYCAVQYDIIYRIENGLSLIHI